MNGLIHGITVIWLDAYIGDPSKYSRLKAAFFSNIDPTNLEPINLRDKNTNDASSNNLYSLFSPRTGIPCELQSFTDPDACLKGISDSLNAEKRIFLIVSDSIGKTFLSRVIMEYPQAVDQSEDKPGISIYIFLSYWGINGDFVSWLLDSQLDVVMFDHESDLLSRLVRDIAMHYMEAGQRLLDRTTPVDSRQALIYFEWASALLHHTKNIAIYQDLHSGKALENLMLQAKTRINNDMSVTQNDQYSKSDIEKSLNNSLFIYDTTEFLNETTQLITTLNQLTGEKEELFDNLNNFITKFQEESCTTNDYCPIVISSNNDNRIQVLKELSSLTSVNSIYILNPNESTVQDDRTLTEFPKVRSIYLDAKILALEWTAERASNCTKFGRRFTKKGDFDVARMYYDKAIKLNENLAVFIKKN